MGDFRHSQYTVELEEQAAFDREYIEAEDKAIRSEWASAREEFVSESMNHEEVIADHEQWVEGAPGGRPAELQGENLVDDDLLFRDLSNADMRYTILYGLDMRRSKFEYTKLDEAVMDEVDLRDAFLRDANLYGASLRRADLRRADFTGAVLTGADLRGADLRGTNFTDANLKGANLTGANIDGAIGMELEGAYLNL